MALKRNENFVYRDEDEEGGLLFDPDIDDVYSLNPVAKAIWENLEMLNEGNLAFVRDLFDEVPSEEALKKDVDELIEELKKINALQSADN